jgi:hypothetical protein
MSGPRIFHTATLLPSGHVLVVGGIPGPEGGLASAELFDPSTGQWHTTAPLPVARVEHTATLLASGQVLVLGGFSFLNGNSGEITSSAELYDPAAGTWTPTAPMLTARSRHTATLLPSGAVLAAGGDGTDGVPILTGAEIYDQASGTWRPTGSLSASHAAHTATRLPSGRVLVVDGVDSNSIIPNTELFDPASETWSDAGCTVEPRVGHTATLLLSGAVLVAGGAVASGGHITNGGELYGIFVSPAQVNLAPGASQTFTARGGSGFDYVWSFKQNNSGGTLPAAGLYQAGPMGGVTDVLQVVDSVANSATATVNVTQQATTVSAISPHANAGGCSSTSGAAVPSLPGVVLVLLGWTSIRRLRRGETAAQQKRSA